MVHNLRLSPGGEEIEMIGLGFSDFCGRVYNSLKEIFELGYHTGAWPIEILSIWRRTPVSRYALVRLFLHYGL